MSHFTTIVVTRNGQDPEELLAPYIEQEEDGFRQYFEFDVEVEAKDFAKRAKEIVDELKKDDKELEEWKQLLKDKKYTEILEKWFGGVLHKGDWGYWHNPNAKWDWYAFGGRWAGYFKAKKGKTGERGEPSWGRDEKWKYPEGYYDALRFEDIDWEGQLDDEAKKTIKGYRKAEKEFKKWYDEEEKKVDFNDETQKNDFHERRKKKLDDIKFKTGHDISSNLEDVIDKIYGQDNKPHAFITPDGKWHEAGRMGWWAIVSDEKPLAYRKAWKKLLTESKPDDKFYLYDLHI